MDSIETVTKALQGKQRKCKAVRAVNMAVYVAAVALFFVRNLRPAALALMAAGLLLHFLAARRLTQAYRVEVTQANLRFGLCGGLTDFTYAAKGGMSYEDFCSWQLSPIWEGRRSLLCRSAFTARDGRLLLTGQEATFHYEVPNPHGRGSVRFLSGALLTAGAPGKQGWLFLRSGVVNEAAMAAFLREQSYEAEPNSPEGWTLYKQSGVPDLPADLLSQVERLEPSVSILRLTGQGIAAFLNGRFYVGSRYPTAQPTAQLLLENTLAERDSLWALFRNRLGQN